MGLLERGEAEKLMFLMFAMFDVVLICSRREATRNHPEVSRSKKMRREFHISRIRGERVKRSRHGTQKAAQELGVWLHMGCSLSKTGCVQVAVSFGWTAFGRLYTLTCWLL